MSQGLRPRGTELAQGDSTKGSLEALGQPYCPACVFGGLWGDCLVCGSRAVCSAGLSALLGK